MSKFLKVVVNIILICSILVAGGLLIPPFAGVTTVIVDDVSMDTNLARGSVTYALKRDAGTIKEGDKVLVQEEQSQYLYEVGAADGENLTLEDKLSTDGSTLEKPVSGSLNRVVLTVPYIGYVSTALRTTEGLIIVGLAVVFVVILFILAEIWKKDEDEDEEEDDEEDEDGEEPPLSKRQQKKADKLAKKQAKADEKAAKKSAKKSKKNKNELMEEPSEEKPQSEPAHAKVEEDLTADQQTQEKEPDLFEETRNTLAADIAGMMGEEAGADVPKTEEAAAASVPDTADDLESAIVQAVSAQEEAETVNEPEAEKKLAIPVYTKEELLERAKAAGEEPDIVEDEVSGVTILDYSDIL